MTDLSKRVARRTMSLHRGRRLIVTLEPGDMVGIRLERCRQVELMPIAAIYDMAVKARVLSERNSKRKVKK